MKLFVSLFIIATTLLSTSAQNFTNWKNYSDMKDIKDFTVSQNEVTAAANGGGFIYKFAEQSYQTFSKANGFNGTSLSSVAIDQYGKKWFGSQNGLIDVLDQATGDISTIREIFNSDKTAKSINKIIASGDTIYLATDFGISLVNNNSLLFLDTYFKFGEFSSNTPVNNILIKDLIYVSTDAGVAIQKPGSTNLSAPESWNVYNSADGLPSNKIYELLFFQQELIAATNKGVAVFNFQNQNWQSFIPALANTDVKDIIVAQNLLYILSSNKIFEYNNTQLNEVYSSAININEIAFEQSLGLLAATQEGILVLSDSSKIFPNGPAANQFPNMIVDNSGNLWSSSGKDNTGKGFYTFDGSGWLNYTAADYPEIGNNAYFSIFASPDNTIYSGNWGGGFVRLQNNSFTRFTAANTMLAGIPQNPNFLVITGFGKDSRNNLWVLNLWAADRNTLSMLTSDSTWYSYQIPSANGRILKDHFNLKIDQYDTKWFNCLDPTRVGLFYFNENKTYDDATDDRSGFLTTSSGLNSNDISSVVVDKRGDIWVGTGLGVNIISNTGTILSSTNPQLRINSVFSVRQQNITSIAVDPLNQKWLGTNAGLILVNSDGTQLLATLDSKNSPLLSDQIESIAIDEKSGRVFVGTSEGLTSFDTPSILPAENFNGLFVYPSPFVLKDGSQLVTIDGLIRDSQIKILNIAGALIRELETPGGRIAFWDGKDSDGNLVSTGIYIVVAFDRDGNSIETGKIAVLRQ